MNSRTIVLVSAALLAVVLVVLLYLKIGDSSAPAVSEDRLAAARAAHERRAAAAARATPARDPLLPPIPRSSRATPELPPAAEPIPPEPAPRKPTLETSFARPQIRVLGAGGNAGTKEAMDEANRLYDRSDYEGAYEAAIAVLKESPQNIRMLRIVVSAACIMGDGGKARQYSEKLPGNDRLQMRARCQRYGVEL